MCGTGTGVCYLRREVQDRIWPLMGPPGDPKDGAKKYEALGKANLEARVRALSARFRAGLKAIPGVKMWTSEDPAFAAGLTLFSVREIPMANVQQAILNRDRIDIRTMTTGNLNGCRAATHIYNMPDEVDHLLASIRHVAENASRYMTTTAEVR